MTASQPVLIPAGPGEGLKHIHDPGEPSTLAPRISVTPEECNFLRIFAKERSVLEIGTGLGISAEAMALSATSVTTIDIDPWVRENIWPRLAGKNILCIDHIPTDHDKVYTMVFIDGSHIPEDFTADLDYALSVMSKRGIIVCHDAIELADHIPFTEPGWAFIPTKYGLAIYSA